MTCSVFSCCDGSQKTSLPNPSVSRQNSRTKQRGVVLLLASSDVLHALRSNKINVLLVDVRSPENFHSFHIRNAVNFPCHRVCPPTAEDIICDSVMQDLLRKVNPGALSNLLRTQPASEQTEAVSLGTCLVVYDGIGDTKDVPGPASIFAQLLIEKDLVLEVGQLAGGFEAFKELNACIESSVGRSSSSPGSMDCSGARQSGDSTDVAARLSRAATPPAQSLLRVSSSSRRNTSKWSVTINTPQEVGPAEVLKGRLFLGNKNHANDKTILQNLHITHVINISRDSCKPFENDGLVYHHCYIADSVTSDVSKFFEESSDFINQAFKSGPDTAILVHCAGGVSRSSALVAAYLMRSQSLSLADALQHIRTCHPAAAPNSGFIHQLMKLEESLGVVRTREPSFQDLSAVGYSTSFPFESTPGAAQDVAVAGGSPSQTLTWLDYAAAPPTPAPARGKALGGVRQSSRPWDESPAAEGGPCDGGPAAKRSHWDVIPLSMPRGSSQLPPPSPAAAGASCTWEEPPTPTNARTPSSGLGVWPESPTMA